MTLLIATVTEDVGYVTQDTFVSGLSPGSELPAWTGGTLDFEAASRATAAARDGKPPQAPTGFACKLGIFPQHRLIVGAVGGWAATQAWHAHLGTRLVADIDEINEWAPRQIAECHEADPRVTGLFLVHVGYSQRHHRVCGFAYDSTRGFEPVPMGAGHSVHPVIPVSDSLRACWNAAAFGCGAEGFHLALAKEAHAAYRRCELHSLTGIGGEVHAARVTEEGIDVRIPHRLPEYEAQLADVRRERALEMMAAAD